LESSPDSALYPFGCLGPIKVKNTVVTDYTAAPGMSGWIRASGSIGGVSFTGSYISTASVSVPASTCFAWPSMKTRTTSQIDGLSTPKQAFLVFGMVLHIPQHHLTKILLNLLEKQQEEWIAIPLLLEL
jgi:hypothetical protein